MSTYTPTADAIAALVIPAAPDADPRVVDIGPTLPAIRAHVGAANNASIPYLEVFRLGDTAVMYLDEDGKAKGLPVNLRATLLAWMHGLRSPDHIVGDVLVVGPEDHNGDDRSVPSDVVTWAEGVWRTVGVGRE
jgi:hypothetical protein